MKRLSLVYLPGLFFGVTPGHVGPKAPQDETFVDCCKGIFLHATYA